MGFFDTLSAAFSGSSGSSVSEITDRAAADRAAHAARTASPTGGVRNPLQGTSMYSDGTRYFGGPAATPSYPAVPDRTAEDRYSWLGWAETTRYPATGDRYERPDLSVNWSDTAPRPIAATADPTVSGVVEGLVAGLSRVLPREVNVGVPASIPGAVPQGGGFLDRYGAILMIGAVGVGVFLVLRGR